MNRKNGFILYLLYIGLLISAYFDPTDPIINPLVLLFSIGLPFLYNLYKKILIPEETKFIYTLLFIQFIPFFGPVAILLFIFISLSLIDYLVFNLSGKDVI
ncbi:MAG: hypothetical protein B6U78_03090 [Candidatus Aenigmarchaeota archaeon ex4484_224]|nr:MAG: hypothetical protein B6U78_03090 [Candidatus Aenigmarchaeota archaeon ex4484_224]